MKTCLRCLIDRVDATVQNWGNYLQKADRAVVSDLEIFDNQRENSRQRKCPLAQWLPHRQELEAMVGDFNEHVEKVSRNNTSLRARAGATLIWFTVLVSSICMIAIDNFIFHYRQKIISVIPYFKQNAKSVEKKSDAPLKQPDA